ncbi:MAG: hypothetical protein KBG40_09240 [Bacteroidales bacterium]|nr:hypothetical protein [Bacteroidales bacterium]
MKRVISIFLFLLIVSFIVEAQVPRIKRKAPSASDVELWKLRRYEFIAGSGTTHFFGDIGGFSIGENSLGLKDISLRHTRYNFTAGMKYRIAGSFGIKFNLTGGSFHSTDVRGSNETRGLKSSTTFIEPMLTGEYYFIRSKGESSFSFLKGKRVVSFPILSTLTVYGFTGIGGLAYSVNLKAPATFTGTTDKGGFTPVIPVGAGASMSYSGRMNFGVELGRRFTFSDYIDGYTSQFSKKNDTYYMLTFFLSVKLPTSPRGLPSFRNILL